MTRIVKIYIIHIIQTISSLIKFIFFFSWLNIIIQYTLLYQDVQIKKFDPPINYFHLENLIIP